MPTAPTPRDARLADEIRADLAAVEAFVDEHGSFADMARAHYDRESETAVTPDRFYDT